MDELESKIELTDRQKKLLKFLQDAFREDKTKWISSKEIYHAFEFDLIDNYNDHTEATAYKAINEDYHAINSDSTVPNIIVPSRNNGYKIATEEEAKDYFNRKDKSLRHQFKLLGIVGYKAKIDGYEDIFSGNVRKAYEV